jgi:hypothetical protein
MQVWLGGKKAIQLACSVSYGRTFNLQPLTRFGKLISGKVAKHCTSLGGQQGQKRENRKARSKSLHASVFTWYNSYLLFSVANSTEPCPAWWKLKLRQCCEEVFQVNHMKHRDTVMHTGSSGLACAYLASQFPALSCHPASCIILPKICAQMDMNINLE